MVLSRRLLIKLLTAGGGILWVSSFYSHRFANATQPPQSIPKKSSNHQGRTWVVAQKHPDAQDNSAGTAAAPFKTISRAATLAEPGDTILVHEGVYRERVAPAHGGEANRPISYRAAPGETVVIKGSEVLQPEWQPTPDHPQVYLGKLNPSLFPGVNPYHTALKASPLAGMTLGQVFVDGQPLLEVNDRDSLLTRPETWMVSPDREMIWIHFSVSPIPPKQRVVELTTRGRIFAPYQRGLGHIVVQGFVMEHCANQFPFKFWQSDSPQAGALGCRGGHHWMIENNTIRLAKTVAIDCGSEGQQDADGLGQPEPKNSGYHLIRNNHITNNGAAGIMGIRSYGTKIIDNVIEENVSLGLDGSETAGIKLHRFMDGVIEGNLIRNNGAAGIWLDNGWYNSRVTRNVILNNNGAGLFIEMGTGALLVDNNIIALNTAMRTLPGDGIYSHDASGVTIAHNMIFFNANFGIWSHIGTDRIVKTQDGSRKIVGASSWRVLNNMVIGNHRGAISLPFPTERSQDNLSDYNLITAAYDWTTAETYGKALDQPSFIYNTNKDRVPITTLVQQFQQALDRAQIPQSARPNLQEWGKLPLLSFTQWQLLTHNDRHSLIPKIIRPDLSVSVPFLRFAIDDSPHKFHCKPIAGIERDFLGNPMPTEKIMPGPFQQLKFEPALNQTTHAKKHQGPYGNLKVNENFNTFILWPLPQSSFD